MRASLARPLLLAVLLLCSAAVKAQGSTGEARLREALRSTTGQLRALEEEQQKWQAKEAQHKQEVEALKQQLAAAQKASARRDSGQAAKKACDAKVAGVEQRLEDQTTAVAKASSSLAQCQQDGLDAQQAARARDDERVQLVGKLDGVSARAAGCEAKNARLYQVGKEILDWLGNTGVGTALMAREPFLGLKRVELENVAQDYQDKLLDQKISSQK